MKRQLQRQPVNEFRLSKALGDYSVLKAEVGEVLIAGRARIEKEFLRMRYHTGLLINEHIRRNSGRAAYGTNATLRLEKDFGIDHTELNRYAQFARAYPIDGGRRQLTFNLPWTHYRKLMTVSDDKTRARLTAEAEEKGWSFGEVESKVRFAARKKLENKEAPSLAPVTLGEFFTYQITRAESLHQTRGELLLDCGFSLKKELGAFEVAGRLTEGAIVTSVKTARGYKLKPPVSASDARKLTADSCLYTYKAYVLKVIDGDTLKVDFRLGFGDRKGETIRLNHIDCPEMSTPEGKAAKRFTESRLANCEFIIVKSVRTRKEKWGRYLGEVFLPQKGKDPLYLNRLLLEKGHAVKLPR